MDEIHDDYEKDLITTIDDDRAKAVHVMDPFAGFMFGTAFTPEGDIEQQQFEKHGNRVRLLHGDDNLIVEGV